MVAQKEAERREVTLPVGAEINYGLNEDSDSYILKEPLIVIAGGQVREGGLPILVPALDNKILYYHQPERPLPLNKAE